MRKLLMLSGSLLFLGCGGGGQDFVINGLALQVKDQIYTSKPTGFFCDTVPNGQIQIVFTDYSPGCALDVKPGDPDPRDPGTPHTEIDIILGGLGAGNGHENLMKPFTLSKFDCKTSGDNGTAYFKHFQSNSTTPDTTIQVSSGTVKLDQWDPTGKLTTKGSFDLTFGGSTVSGKIDALSCDPTG